MLALVGVAFLAGGTVFLVALGAADLLAALGAADLLVALGAPDLLAALVGELAEARGLPLSARVAGRVGAACTP